MGLCRLCFVLGFTTGLGVFGCFDCLILLDCLLGSCYYLVYGFILGVWSLFWAVGALWAFGFYLWVGSLLDWCWVDKMFVY